MRYLPTIQLWGNGMTTALVNGQLRLQTGQWVQCGRDSKPSRFVGVTASGTIWAAHWHPDRGRERQFRDMAAVYRGQSGSFNGRQGDA